MRLAILLVLGCSSPREPTSTAIARPRIVAHRGASHEAPENTLAAFRRAWEQGVEGVELDVRVTRDGEVVVIHDATTKRTAGVDRAVAEQTLAELKTLDAGAWKGQPGERIPTIAEALATVPAGHTLFVEIKTGRETVPVVARAIRVNDPRPRGAKLALQGFDPDVLAALAAELPDVPAYWTVDPPADDQGRPLPYSRAALDDAARRGFAGVALFHGSVDDALLAAARQRGLLVDVWTVNERAQLDAWRARDVRWIETDRPELVD